MATEKPRISITIDEDILKKIDDHWYENRFSNRTQAVLDILEKGLLAIENSKTDNPEVNK